MRYILQPFYTAYVIVTFVIGLIVTFPFYVVLGAANSIAGRRAIYNIVRLWARVWLWVIGMPVQVLGYKPAERSYVIVANHISYMDTVVLFTALPKYFRALGKKEFSRVPVLGFLYKQIAVMVDRSSQQSRAKSMRLMWRVLKHEADIIIFPEGTFNETGRPLKDFYSGAFRLAINTGVPILPVIFPDTVHRWHYSGWWKIWPGKNRAIFLEPIAVDGLTLDDVDMLKTKTYVVMEAALRAYPYP